MSDTTFAIEINERYTRIADLKYHGKKIELTSLGQIDTAPNFFDTDNQLVFDKQVEVIKRLHSNLKIRKRKAAVIIPDSRTFSQIIEMPQLKEKELIAAIRYQADEFIPMPINETYLDLEILKEDPKNHKMLVLIVAAPKKTVDTVFDVLERAQLEPEFLENEMASAGRIFSEILAPKSKIYVVVNFGYVSTSIYLIDGTSKIIVYARTIKLGLDIFIKDLKVNLNWDESKIIEVLKTVGLAKTESLNLGEIILPLLKEFIAELEKVVATSKQTLNLPVDSIYLYNFDTAIAYLPQYLQAYFKIPCTTAQIAANLEENPISK